MLIRRLRRVFEIQPVPSFRDNESLITLRVRHKRLNTSGNTGHGRISRRQTVTTAKGQVTLSSNDEDRPRELANATDGGADREQFTDGDRLTQRTGREFQSSRVELSRREEIRLHGGRVARAKVAGDILGREGWDSRDRHKITAKLEVRQERPVDAEAGENQAVGEVGLLAGELEALDRAERMADVHDFVERRLLRKAGDLPCSGESGQFLERGDFEGRLDLVDGLAVRRRPDAQPVPGQRGEAVLADRARHIRVVEIVQWDVPVRPVEPDAVREDLQRLGASACRSAICRRQIVGARHVRVLLNCRGAVVVALLRQIEDEVGDLDVCLGRCDVEDGVSRGYCHGDGEVLALEVSIVAAAATGSGRAGVDWGCECEGNSCDSCDSTREC